MKKFQGADPAFGPVYAGRDRDRFEPQADVLRDRQIGKQGGLLVNAGDAKFVRRGRGKFFDALTVDLNGAAIGLVRAGDDLDERGLARAVLAEERVNFPCPQIKRHPLQSPHRAEVFGDGLELEQWRGRHAGIQRSSNSLETSIETWPVFVHKVAGFRCFSLPFIAVLC